MRSKPEDKRGRKVVVIKLFSVHGGAAAAGVCSVIVNCDNTKARDNRTPNVSPVLEPIPV